jgi:hypothetical protein
VGALVALLAWNLAAIGAMNRLPGGVHALGGSPTEELLILRLSQQVYPDPALRQLFEGRLGMPACPGLAQQTLDRHKTPAEYRKCPALQGWVRRNADLVGVRFAVASPGGFARATAPLLDRAVSGRQPNRLIHGPLPAAVETRIFPSDQSVVSVPFGLALLCACAGALFAARTRGVVAPTGVSLAAVAVLSLAAMLAFVVESLPRLGIQEAILTRVALVMLITAGIDAGIARIRRHRARAQDSRVPHQQADPTPPTSVFAGWQMPTTGYPITARPRPTTMPRPTRLRLWA